MKKIHLTLIALLYFNAHAADRSFLEDDDPTPLPGIIVPPHPMYEDDRKQDAQTFYEIALYHKNVSFLLKAAFYGHKDALEIIKTVNPTLVEKYFKPPTKSITFFPCVCYHPYKNIDNYTYDPKISLKRNASRLLTCHFSWNNSTISKSSGTYGTVIIAPPYAVKFSKVEQDIPNFHKIKSIIEAKPPVGFKIAYPILVVPIDSRIYKSAQVMPYASPVHNLVQHIFNLDIAQAFGRNLSLFQAHYYNADTKTTMGLGDLNLNNIIITGRYEFTLVDALSFYEKTPLTRDPIYFLHNVYYTKSNINWESYFTAFYSGYLPHLPPDARDHLFNIYDGEGSLDDADEALEGPYHYHYSPDANFPIPKRLTHLQNRIVRQIITDLK